MNETQFNVQAPFMHDLVRLHGKWLPEKPAFIDHKSTHSWKMVDDNSNRIANGLIALGIEKGDCVSILMSNSIEYAEIIYGVWKAGAIIVPLNLAVTEQGLQNMHNDAAIKVAFYTSSQYKRMQPYLEAMPSIEHNIVFGSEKFDAALDYETWLSAQSTSNPNIAIEDMDACNIIYSSGTTGRPKGIKHTHRRRMQALHEMALMHRYHYGAISICSIGLYSNIAWAPLLLSLLTGGTCIIQKSFNPEEWIELVKRHKATHTMMAPIMFQRILVAKNFSPESVASLETMVSGGSPLFEELKQQIAENFNCNIIELYGLTEGFITSLQPEHAKGRLASVGKPVTGNDYVLVDKNDEELGWGNTGEICAYSIHMMTEYHNRPDATKEAMYTDKNGKIWLRTGDIGTIDKDGFLYITDRKKDMIISGGQNIYPADIEAVMIKHPDISEVAVISMPDEKWGETPVALIVPTRTDIEAEGIKNWTNSRVGKRQRIKEVIIRSDMPRNPNGKILKRKLRKELLS